MKYDIAWNKNVLLIFALFLHYCLSKPVSVGNGSYTNSFPGTDSAGRDGFPSGSSQVSGVKAPQNSGNSSKKLAKIIRDGG